MDKKDKKQSRKRGEDGFWERSTDAAHAATAKRNSVFETAEDFVEAVEKYFAKCDEEGKLYGEAGMCLGLTKYNKKGRNVTLRTLRDWYDGVSCEYLQDVVQMAYLRIQEQIDTNPVYHEKNMATRGIFLQKQARYGGYQDKTEAKQETTVKIIHGVNVDDEDFK